MAAGSDSGIFTKKGTEKMNLQELKLQVCREIDRHRGEVLDFGTEIWEHPEPGYREIRTAGRAAEKLEELGLTVKRGIAVTGFRADMDTGREGPVVALLGEMDALLLPTHPAADPVTGAVHACGHNCHITSLVGAAIGLSAAGVLDSCSGKIALVGVPAEKTLDPAFVKTLRAEGKIRFDCGKPELIRCGVFDDVDIALMNHAGGDFSVNDFNGYLRKEITFHGKSSHAALPQEGINAMSAANLAQHALALTKDRWTADPYVRVHGLLSHAGDAVNVVPDRVELSYMLRGGSTQMLAMLSRLFDRAFNGAAYALETSCEIETRHGSSPLKNSDALCELYRRCVSELVPDARVSIKTNYQPGCTDMGDMSMIVPSLHGYFPGCEGPCHSPEFRIGNPEQTYLLSSKLLACMALELLAGDAETGRRIALEKKEKLPIPEYLNQISALESHTIFPPKGFPEKG